MALSDYALQGETKEDKVAQYGKLEDSVLENMRTTCLENKNWAPYKEQALEVVLQQRQQDPDSKFYKVTFNG